MTINELTSKARELKELQRMAEELETMMESIKDEIKACMGESEEMVAGEYKIRWATVKSSRFDTSAFKEKYSDLYSQFAKPTVSRRFSIV